MAETLREVVSRVRSTDKLISGDNSINERTIAAECKSEAKVYIRQYANRRLLWQTDSIFTTIPCLEMISVPIGECCSYVSNKMISRSKHKIPSVAESNYDYIIQGVYSIGLNKKLIETTINSYINILRLNLKGDNVYYWIHDEYLYCSSEFVQSLKVVAYLEGDLTPEIEFPECECEHSIGKDKCKNPLDETFKCPGFLIGTVVDKVRDTLLRNYFKIPNDHTSDNKDDQTNKN